MAECFNCEQELRPVLAGNNTNYQYDNALWIGLFGGYGMFIESPDAVDNSNIDALNGSGATFELVLCHDCAHKLCVMFPKLEGIIDTHSAHSHRLGYVEENPDHYGWDYDEILEQ